MTELNPDNKLKTTTNNWLQLIGNHRLISSLTIPGTHDTMTYSMNYPNIGNQCQNISLPEQLERGIRFIDIRLRYDTNNGLLKACHANWDCTMYFPDIVKMCKDFLDLYPSECIIMSIKNESGDWGDQFVDSIYTTAIEDQQHWHYGDTIPTLGEVRGKIVLFRRYKEENSSHQAKANIGINLTDWPDNMPFQRPEPPTHPTKIKYTIQDEYKAYSGFNVLRKFNDYMKPTLEQAINNTDMDRLYINFASGTGMSPPYVVANYTLELLLNYLKDSNAKWGRYGIIPMDFPEKDYGGNVIQILIESNFIDELASGDQYVIHSKTNQHFVFDIFENHYEDNTPVNINQFNGGHNQKWLFEKTEDNSFFIKSYNSPDKTLISKNNSTNAFNPTVIFTFDMTDNQKWIINKSSNKFFQFKMKTSEMALDIAYGKIKNSNPICIYNYTTTDEAELFQLSFTF